jgi:hypothetical protein
MLDILVKKKVYLFPHNNLKAGSQLNRAWPERMNEFLLEWGSRGAAAPGAAAAG